MLLVQINNFTWAENRLQLKLLHNKKIGQKLKQQKAFSENFKNTKTLIKTNFFYNLNKLDLIRYIIGVKFLKKNTVAYITDIHGKLKHCISGGYIKLNKKQKTTKQQSNKANTKQAAKSANMNKNNNRSMLYTGTTFCREMC